MTKTYLNDSDVKDWLGISGTSKDSKVAMAHKAATKVIDGLLNVRTLARHLVTDELRTPSGEKFIDAGDINVARVLSIAYRNGGPVDLDVVETDNYRVRLSAGISGDVLMSYVAGWAAAGEGSFVVTSPADLEGKKVTLVVSDSVSKDLVEGTDWNRVEGDASATAAAIAKALAGTGLVDAWAEGATVWACDLTPGRETLEVTTDATTGISLAGHDLTLDGADFPDDLKLAVCVMAGDLLSRRGNSGVKSYTVGGKTVTFADAGAAAQFTLLLKRYVRGAVCTGKSSAPINEYRLNPK